MRNVVVNVQAVHQDVQDSNLKAALEVPVLCLALPNSDGNVELEEVEREARAYATKRLLCMQPEALLCKAFMSTFTGTGTVTFYLQHSAQQSGMKFCSNTTCGKYLYCDWLCTSICRSERL